MRRSLATCVVGLSCVSLYACSQSSTSGGDQQSAGAGVPSGGASIGIAGSTAAGSPSTVGGGAPGGAGAATAGAPSGGDANVAGTSAGGASGGAVGVGGGASAGASAGGASGAGGAGTPSTSKFKIDGVATWRGNATAAYSIIHDDVCDDSAAGVVSIGGPQLKKHGLHAGFGVIVGECNKDNVNKWPGVKGLIADGNDIFSHSWSHPCIDGVAASPPDACPPPPDAVYSSDMATEIGKAGDELKTQTGVALDFFIFPYDYCDPKAITYLKGKGYLGARCGLTDGVPTNPSDFADPFAIFYDVFGPAYSYYWDTGVCKDKISQYNTEPYDLGDGSTFAFAPASCITLVLQKYVDDTIAAKDWGVREFHGFHPIDDSEGAFEPISEADYSAHLDYIKTKQDSGALWVEGPTPVLRYRFARTSCAAPTFSTSNTLHFAAPSADCTKYATVVSYLVSTTDATDPTTLKVTQGGKVLPAKRLSAGHYAVDANPTAGDAVISQ